MFKDKISKELVRERMAYPYEIKVRMTERRLKLYITVAAAVVMQAAAKRGRK